MHTVGVFCEVKQNGQNEKLLSIILPQPEHGTMFSGLRCAGRFEVTLGTTGLATGSDANFSPNWLKERIAAVLTSSDSSLSIVISGERARLSPNDPKA